MINKKNLPLIIAVCIPVLMIILVAAFVYFPGIGKYPKQNFLYLTSSNGIYYNGNYENGNRYEVSNNHLVEIPKPTPSNDIPGQEFPPYKIVPDNAKFRFYLYNVTEKTATELTFEEAQKYSLDSSSMSEDGYMVSQGNYRGGDFIFGGGGAGDYSWYIRGHNRSFKLNLKLSGSSYYGDIQFLGWVK
jgi:hypothetical protein